MTWRDHARPIIAEVIKENKDKPIKEIRKALREAYPFGYYGKYWPYKVWLDEIRIQLGLKRGYDPKDRKPIPILVF